MIIGKWKSESAREEFNKLAKKSNRLHDERDSKIAEIKQGYDDQIENIEEQRNMLLDEHYKD